MATVIIQKYKGKRGTTYSVRYKDPITRRSTHYKSFKRYKDANQSANELRTIIDSGRLPEKNSTKFTPMTFNEVALKLTKEWQSRNKRGDLADKTLYEYKNRQDIVCRTFGTKLLIKITEAEIANHIETIAEEWTNVTANKTLSTIKKVFAHGAKLKAVIKDITKDIEYLSEKDHERNNFHQQLIFH